MTADVVLDRCAELAAISDERGRLTRVFAGPAMARAHERVRAWMGAAGLSVRVDAAGNLIGRREGPSPGAPTLVLGSHLDTVQRRRRVRRAAGRARRAGGGAAPRRPALRGGGGRVLRRGGRALRHRLPGLALVRRHVPGRAADAHRRVGNDDGAGAGRLRRRSRRARRRRADRRAAAGLRRGAHRAGPGARAARRRRWAWSTRSPAPPAPRRASPVAPATPGRCRWRSAATRSPRRRSGR